MTIILGIDPGSRTTGYGLVRIEQGKQTYLDSGCVRIVKANENLPLADRLRIVFDSISNLIADYHPDEVAIEKVFLSKNADSALKLGQARGVAIVAAAVHALDVAEYSALEVKKSVVGTGKATKEQVQHMVRILLALDKELPMDASDALGIALCHAHSRAITANYAEAIS